jgi:hypothetical protein
MSEGFKNGPFVVRRWLSEPVGPQTWYGEAAFVAAGSLYSAAVGSVFYGEAAFVAAGSLYSIAVGSAFVLFRSVGTGIAVGVRTGG